MVPLSAVKKKENWQLLPATHEVARKFAANMPYLYRANAPGATFTIRFRGKALGIYDVIGPNSGMVEVVVDGGPPQSITRFDGWCHYYRKNAFFLKDIADGEHEVTFVVSDKPVDKAAILAKRNIPFTKPADYSEKGWYVNNILLVGELTE